MTANTDSVIDDVLAALHARWMTSREVWQVIPKWHVTSVRNALATLADDGKIETQVAGTDARPVREYRRKV